MTTNEAIAQLRDKAGLFAEQLAAWDRRIVEIVAIGSLAKEDISPKEIIELICTFEPEPSDESLGFFTLVNLLLRDDYEHASEKLGIPNTIDLGFKMGGKVYLPNGVISKSRKIRLHYGSVAMSQDKSDNAERYAKWLSLILDLPWIAILAETWKLGRKILRGFADEGIYEVLDYEVTLELRNDTGTRAKVKKRKRVRYLQNGIIAYTDWAWGDGKTILDYKCSPGVAVDRYHSGYKTYILLSLREVKNRGDEDEFNIQWNIHDGFLKPDGFWDTDITNRTKQMKVNVIFPKSRPPQRFVLEESNRGKTHLLGSEAKRQLPDGRWLVSWQKDNPHLYEHYLLRWWW